MEGVIRKGLGNRLLLSKLFSAAAAMSRNSNRKTKCSAAPANAPPSMRRSKATNAADLVKVAMIRLNASLSIPLPLQVHDELLFECPKDDAKDCASEIQKVMEGVHPLAVPLKVNVSSGKNWDDAH